MSPKKRRLPMNLPNTLTLIRIALIPLCIILLTGNLKCRIGAGLVFALASFTDHLDGYFARKRNEITDFGKFMDPIADKLLVLLPMVYLIREIPSSVCLFAVMMMVAREIIVSGFRLVASTRGSVIAAGKSGKLKTVVQMIACLMLIFNLGSPDWNALHCRFLALPVLNAIAWWLLCLAALLSIYSGAEILIRNFHILEVEE